jgi:hypothetical protein
MQLVRKIYKAKTTLTTDSDSLDLRSARLLEVASAELARLDVLLSTAPAAFSVALRLAATARAGSQGAIDTTATTRDVTTRAQRDGARDERTIPHESSLAALIAATVESRHAESLHPSLAAAQDFVNAEEALVREGKPLASSRLAARRIALWDASAVDAAAKAGHSPRPALLRAVAIDAAVVEPAAASAVAALLLCGTGVTERVRLLPFVDVAPGDRAEALGAWADGDHEPWRVAALTELARAARERQRDVADAFAAMPEGDAALDAIGRGAITARAALALLHAELAASVPSLSARLGLSRPAAGDALERLVELGLATEVTGRARDRVFALASAVTCAAPNSFSA